MGILRIIILSFSLAHLFACGNSVLQNQRENSNANTFDIKSPLTAKIVSVKDRLSFGFCRIDCNQEITIENAKVVYTVTGNGDLRHSVKQLEGEVTTQEWSDILQFIDRESFLKIPNVIGQPDGGDEGAERVEISFGDRTTKSTIFSWRSEPQELKEFTKKIAIIRERFSKQMKKEEKSKGK